MSVVFSLNFPKAAQAQEETNLPADNGILLKGSNQCAMLLVHGLTGTPNEMKFLAYHFYKHGYSVICPRLANHGAPLAVLKNTQWQEFYQSVREAFLQARKAHQQVFVAGLSMSALLVLLLAEEFKGEVAGVTCLSPTLFFDGWNSPWYRCFLPLVYRTPLKYWFYFKEDPPYGIKNEDIRQLVHKYYNGARLDDMSGVAKYGYPFFPLTLLYQLHLLVKHVIPRLGDISVPVQLIQAKYDDTTSEKNSQFIYDRVKSKMKEITLLYDSYHVVTADQERSQVAQKMEEFFEKVTSTDTLSVKA